MRLHEGRKAGISFTGAALCLCGASVLSGCGYAGSYCWEEETCEQGPPLPPTPPSPCDGDPATAPAVDGCGVFVSALGSDTNPGTRDKPFGTLQHAIDVAHGKPSKRVYACEGRFPEEVRLSAGVDLWGARRCEDGSWAFTGSTPPTTIAPPVGVPLRVVQGGEEAQSTICGVELLAADASAPDGKSSIAMIVREHLVVNLLHSKIQAGYGKNGEAGTDAPLEPASYGAPGNFGADACSADLVPGAARMTNECAAAPSSVGGRGGDGLTASGGDGEDGLPASGLNGTRYGQGGRGASTLACEEGRDGLEGGSGAAGRGGAGLGMLDFDGWQGANGQAGARGTVGQGGGGGGGLAGRGICEAGQRGGLPGGSGGSGGCGGRAGTGGSYGGASIGILAVDATVRVATTEIETKKGGNGGAGGHGQPGGRGGDGGAGGRYMGSTGTPRRACDGGAGGNGGAGGPGGGGAGGPSIGIASWHSTIEKDATAWFKIGDGGQGGDSGSGDVDAGTGVVGVAGHIWDMGGDIRPEEPPR